MPALVQIMAWRRSGDKPLSGPMVVSLMTHICDTRPQWVNDGLHEFMCPWWNPTWLYMTHSSISWYGCQNSVSKSWYIIVYLQRKMWIFPLHYNNINKIKTGQSSSRLCMALSVSVFLYLSAGIILCMRPANERWRYSVTSSLIGWAHSQNDPCVRAISPHHLLYLEKATLF